MKKRKWGIIALSVVMLVVGIFIGNILPRTFIIGDETLIKGNVGELAALDSSGNYINFTGNFSAAVVKDIPSLVQSCAVAAGIINGYIPVDDATWEEFKGAPYSNNLVVSDPVGSAPIQPSPPIVRPPIPPNPSCGIDKCGDGICQQVTCPFACDCAKWESKSRCPQDCGDLPPDPIFCLAVCMPFSPNCDPPGPCNYCCGHPPINPLCNINVKPGSGNALFCVPPFYYVLP